MTDLHLSEKLYGDYQPKSALYFNPDTIVITKGSFKTAPLHNDS